MQDGVKPNPLPPLLCAQTSRQALRDVHLTPREMAVLRRRFEAAGRGGMDVPAVMRFFGRNASRQPIVTGDADQPAGVDTSGQGEELQKAPRRSEDEEARSASEVEVGRRKHTEHTIGLLERFLAVGVGETHALCVHHTSSLHLQPPEIILVCCYVLSIRSKIQG